MILSSQYQLELEMYSNRLQKMFKHISKWARKQNLECYRIYDRDLPRFPFCIEVYKDYAILYEYKKPIQFKGVDYDTFLDDVIQVSSGIIGIDPKNFFYKIREKKKGRKEQYTKKEEKKVTFQVKENSLSFIINLSNYLDSGLFLDHRITRSMVKDVCGSKDFLNLFAYTGSFTVYAASGGAKTTTTIDLSNTYLDIAQRNLQANGFDLANHFFIKTDVMEYIQNLKPNLYDVAVIDPPTFSKSKSMRRDFDIQRDHIDLIYNVMRSIRKGGEIFFSTNFRTFKLSPEISSNFRVKDITKMTIPKDFRDENIHKCYRIFHPKTEVYE